MVKILIEVNEDGNHMKVLESDDDSNVSDALNAIGTPLMHLILDVCDYDYQESVDMLTELLDAYIEANGVGDDIK
ncbi:hypothetical protein 8014-B2_008 [Lactobacillus phage ATCC 8014-B2]|uniref:Uncharacterized protein n=1 Tax=Lactobacillus phage ATCC 8014-B2 TaxID=1225795 RepID=K4I4A8_9CAUD|nr:hypothetical protein HOQ89_gp008 [Lactobacillus phage ATCC 8014-B2]AFU63075.1 hypothetical protein 8014-B2_008 [Lactobacillus phage ATCC 8014-B2]